MRIPITTCNGIRTVAASALSKPLTEERFDQLMGLAAEMRFQSINCGELASGNRLVAGKRPHYLIVSCVGAL